MPILATHFKPNCNPGFSTIHNGLFLKQYYQQTKYLHNVPIKRLNFTTNSYFRTMCTNSHLIPLNIYIFDCLSCCSLLQVKHSRRRPRKCLVQTELCEKDRNIRNFRTFGFVFKLLKRYKSNIVIAKVNEFVFGFTL